MGDIILYKEKSDCCGCGACMNICSKDAIYMEADEYGFLYPKVDKNKCVQCGACLTVCDYQNVKRSNQPMQTYVAVSTSKKIMQSASGGVFFSFAEAILEHEGIVYGSSMEYIDSKLVTMHVAVESKAELVRLQGSKYVQSSIGYIYSNVKDNLTTGRLVLFSGTPCQVGGLRAYLKKEYDNLFLIDIICHGVPNSQFFQDYIAFLEQKIGHKITDFKFRDKTNGWGMTGRAYYCKDDGSQASKLIYCKESSYFMTFLDSDTYRENCYSCRYANPSRAGDVTIGDYWGIETEHPDILKHKGGNLDKTYGVSCLIVNTEKGKKYLEQHGSKMKLWESTFEQVARHNRQLIEASKLNSEKRTLILKMYAANGYAAFDKWWFCKNDRWKMYTIKLVNRIPIPLKRGIKSIIEKFKAI